MELAQLLLAAAFMLLRNRLMPAPNEVGLDANLAFLGAALLMCGLYNVLFFPGYYRAPAKVGKAYVLASTVKMLYIIVVEGLTHIVPFFRDVLDTPDPQHLAVKLTVLVVSTVSFAVLTMVGYRLSAKRFEALDL